MLREKGAELYHMERKMQKMNIGKASEVTRKKKGMSQGAVARLAQWERSYMSDLERNQIPHPSFHTIIRLCEALGISIDELKQLAVDCHDEAPQ